jgi:diguanylate cyclase (GGDEF)-like protein
VKRIRSSLRSFDPIVRYWGDEFVCGLSAMETEEADRRFDAVRKALQEESITISVGLASLRVDETREELVARADAALLEAKRQRMQ